MTVKLGEAKLPADLRVYAIGDIHGRLDLLMQIHEGIEDDLKGRPIKDWRIVHVGDYIDRGPDSRGVIDFILGKTNDKRLVFLCGNHDVRFLDFLDTGEGAKQFEQFGGAGTAASYGVTLDFSTEETIEAGRQALQSAVPEEHKQFFAAIPLSFAAGDFFFCHAGIRPGVPLDKQSDEDLLWIREGFVDHEGLHPKVIVHGHTPHESVELKPNRINIDTRAFETGRLTAIAIEGTNLRVMEANG